MVNLKKSSLSLGRWYKYLFCFTVLFLCFCTQTPDNCSDGNRVDYKTEFCYDGKAVPKCAGNKYDPAVEECVGGSKDGNVEERCINGKYAISDEPCEPKLTAFTVRFDTDGGTPEAISSVTVDSGKTMGTKFPEDPKKTGFIFDGWFDEDKKYDSSTVITKNVTIKAKFKLKQFTVRFDTDGGTPETISSVTVDTGKTMGEKLPSNPAKMGYNFDGWFDEDNKYDSSTVITKDVTLKAKYQVKRFTVQFNTDGGSPSTISPIVVDTGKAIGTENFPSAPTKTGFSFDGWYYADGASYYTSSTLITQNVTLRAQWREGGTSTTKYTLTTSSEPEDGGTVDPPSGRTYESGQSVNVTATPNTGYNFVGWSGASESKENTVTVKMDNDRSLTAKFELKKYTVTFDTDGGTPTIESVTVDTGKTMGEKFPSNPTKTGYTFDGWYDGEDNKYDASTVITKNVTIKAKYLKQFTVTFDADGGTSETIEPVTVDSGKTMGENFPSNTPTKSGHTFDGWYDGDNKYNASTEITKDVTLKAKYQVKKFTVTFDTDGGTPETISPVIVDTGSTMGENFPDAPTKTGHTFVGWVNEDDEYNASTEITKNVTLKAKFDANLYTLEITSSTGGIVVEPEEPGSYAYGTPITVRAEAATNPRYAFVNWTVTEGDAVFENENKTPTTVTLNGNATIRANFVRRYYIAYLPNGGTGIEPDTQWVNSGINVTLASGSGLTRSGHVFAGWNTNPAGTGANFNAGVSFMPMSDTTFYAKWDIVYTLFINRHPSIDAGGIIVNGTTYTGSMQIAGGKPIDISAAANLGYIFRKWTVENGDAVFDYENSHISKITLNSNATITANYYSLVTDKGGNSYRAVKIGAQTWMAENLNYVTADSYCYDDDESYCWKYGRLYNWYDAMSACPVGWRLPTEAEYSDLFEEVGGWMVAGEKLRSQYGWPVWPDNGYGEIDWNGTDDYGFAVLPGGVGVFSNTGDGSIGFSMGDSWGYWWNATEVGDDRARTHNIRAEGSAIYLSAPGSGSSKSDALLSVRCLKND